MASFSPQNTFAQLLTADAPLLSPISSPDYSPWDSMNTDSFFYTTPPSPVESLMSPQSLSAPMPSPEPEQPLCISTQQLFDLPQTDIATEPESPSPPKLSISIKPRASTSTSSKRSASPVPTVAKKARGGERVSSKDFVPPDVSGLSKREARLVKNRAAAFLSRQRKREEFELMEVRLAELEKENARLLALTQTELAPNADDHSLLSEVEQLRAQLAEAEKREKELSAKLAVGNAGAIKTEAPEQTVPLSPKTSPLRSSASLGLMVLLCALPSLLSMPSNNHVHSSFSPSALMSLAPPSSSFDYNSFISNDFDWSKDFSNGGMMDLDIDEQGRISAPDSALSFPSALTQTLAFDTSAESTSADLLGQLGQLDISFQASQPENGKIRVRIHPSSNSVSRASSPPLITSDSFMKDEFLSQPDSYSLSGDPFLLAGGASSSDWLEELPMPGGYDRQSPGLDSDFDACSTTSGGTSSAGKRRVRIALKSIPTSGGEGGEWEVQFC